MHINIIWTSHFSYNTIYTSHHPLFLYYKFYKHLTLIFHVQHIFVGGDGGGGGGGGDDDDIISCNVLCIFFRSDISVGLFQIVHTLGSSSPPTVKLQSHSDLPWSDRPTYVSDPNLLVINITSMQTLCISSQFLLQILQIIILESWCTNWTSRGRGNSKRRSWKSCGIKGVCHQGKLAVPISAETGAKNPLLQTRNQGAKDGRTSKSTLQSSELSIMTYKH